MRGNTNTYVANVNLLTPSIVASKVRFVPYSQHPRTVCMRVEVFGCRYEDAIVSYKAPPGEQSLTCLLSKSNYILYPLPASHKAIEGTDH